MWPTAIRVQFSRNIVLSEKTDLGILNALFKCFIISRMINTFSAIL